MTIPGTKSMRQGRGGTTHGAGTSSALALTSSPLVPGAAARSCRWIGRLGSARMAAWLDPCTRAGRSRLRRVALMGFLSTPTTLATPAMATASGGTPQAVRRFTLGHAHTSSNAPSVVRTTSPTSSTARPRTSALGPALLGRGLASIPAPSPASARPTGEADAPWALMAMSASGTRRQLDASAQTASASMSWSIGSSWSRFLGDTLSDTSKSITRTATAPTTGPRTSSSGRTSSRPASAPTNRSTARPALALTSAYRVGPMEAAMPTRSNG